MVKEETRTVSWLPVVAVLVGLPLLLTFALHSWLGTSGSGDTNELFARIGIRSVPDPHELDSLEWDGLWFARLTVGESSRQALLEQFAGLEESEGPAGNPVTLKLKRAWWDPPAGQPGTYWRGERVTIWNPQARPGAFYLVVDSPSSD